MPHNVPEQFGRYTIEEELGRGTMGVVFRAFDPVLGRAIALKTIHLAHTLSKRRRAAFEQRFLTEARVAAQLQHPGIVVVHDLGRDAESGDLFIALELLIGENLADWIDEERRPDWRETLRIGARVAEALHHAHERGVVHRDIKPANIMVLESGQPKIMDFGIAKIDASQLTTPGELFGTPLYMSPEQALGRAAGPRSDLFSLGSILYALLTGRVPFKAPDVPGILARVAHLDPPRPSEIITTLAPEVDYIVARAMAKDPEQRYADGKAMAEDLDDVRAGRTPRHRAGWVMPERGAGTVMSLQASAASPGGHATVNDGPERRPRGRSRRRAALGLLLFVAVAVWAFERDPKLQGFWRTLAQRGVQSLSLEMPARGPVTASPTPSVSPAAESTPEPSGTPELAVVPVVPSLPSPATTATVEPTATPSPTPAPTPTPEPSPTSTPRATPTSRTPMPTPQSPTASARSRSTPTPAPRASSAPLVSATLQVVLETRVKNGTLRVWVDDRLAGTVKLSGRPASTRAKLSAGAHEIRVQVRTKNSDAVASVDATFSPRQRRDLVARVTKGRLTLYWN